MHLGTMSLSKHELSKSLESRFFLNVDLNDHVTDSHLLDQFSDCENLIVTRRVENSGV